MPRTAPTRSSSRKGHYTVPLKDAPPPTATNVPTRKRKASVFDAVAARVGYESFLPSAQHSSKYRDTQSGSTQAVPPDEVLFRRKGAPTRYEENDIYFAHDDLRAGQKLPNADLLKCLHAYTSDFYYSSARNRGKKHWRSMDETALLAMGILLEEAAKHATKESGDLPFVECEMLDQGIQDEGYWDGQEWRRAVLTKRPHLRKAPQQDTSATDKRPKPLTIVIEEDAQTGPGWIL